MSDEPETVADDARAAPGAFGRLIEIMLDKPEFQQAWLELRDVGLESGAALERVWDMLTQSARHGRLLADETNELVQAAGTWACSMDWDAVDAQDAAAAFDAAAFSGFQRAVAQKVSTVAAAYFLLGAVVGLQTAVAIREGSDPA